MGSSRTLAAVSAAAILLAGVGAAAATQERVAGPQPVRPVLSDPAAAGGPTTAEPVAARAAVDLPTAGTVGATVTVDPADAAQPATVDAGGSCDPIDPAACLLPFPNDRFTTVDPTTDTGRRVDLDLLSMPRNVAGKPIDPTEWNRNDGFSPGTPILARVPGLDLHRTWGSDVDHIADLARYRRRNAPIVLLDAETGERHPFWSELDTHPDTTDDDRLLILRPAVNLAEGHRYIVALRSMFDGAGNPIAPSPAFAAYRDGTATDARAAHMDALFASLEGARIARDDLFLAWDFTVASERNLTERALTIRDDAFAALGDADLADRTVTGAPPAFAVTSVEDFAEGETMRRIEGTVTVPNYLTPQVEAGITGPLEEPVTQLLDALPTEAHDLLDTVEDPLPIGADDLIGQGLVLPGTRFNTLGSPDGLPVVNPLQPTVEVPFVCSIARGSDTEPSDPMLYGHGLLGSRGESTGGSTRALRERGFSPCAVDWWGMSTADLPAVAAILADASNFPTLAERAQQGFLNFLFLGRALAHPGGFAAHPAFQTADGRSLIDPDGLVYDGNSQGGIMGGALTALAPDFERAVLGVPGMNYSTLLNRSVDWEDQYAAYFYAAYPDKIDQQLTFALMQMLWDRAETNGYAHHATTDPLAGTPAHEVYLQVAFADHQVANVTAEVEGRTIGARLAVPAAPEGLHWSADPAWGFRTVEDDEARVGSVLVYWFSDGTGLHTPPNGNVPMADGTDPHEAPRRYGPAVDQASHWLRTGDFLDVCGDTACVIPPP